MKLVIGISPVKERPDPGAQDFGVPAPSPPRRMERLVLQPNMTAYEEHEVEVSPNGGLNWTLVRRWAEIVDNVFYEDKPERVIFTCEDGWVAAKMIEKLQIYHSDVSFEWQIAFNGADIYVEKECCAKRIVRIRKWAKEHCEYTI